MHELSPLELSVLLAVLLAILSSNWLGSPNFKAHFIYYRLVRILHQDKRSRRKLPPWLNVGFQLGLIAAILPREPVLGLAHSSTKTTTASENDLRYRQQRELSSNQITLMIHRSNHISVFLTVFELDSPWRDAVQLQPQRDVFPRMSLASSIGFKTRSRLFLADIIPQVRGYRGYVDSQR